MSLTNPYPQQPGHDNTLDTDVFALQMRQMRQMQNSIPIQYYPAPGALESPHWVSRAPWRPYMFAILSPIILPLLLVYTLVRGIREWGQFVGEITEGTLP